MNSCDLARPQDLDEEQSHLDKLKSQRLKMELLKQDFTRLEALLLEKDADICRLQTAAQEAQEARLSQAAERELWGRALAEQKQCRVALAKSIEAMREDWRQREDQLLAQRREVEQAALLQSQQLRREVKQLQYKYQSVRSSARESEGKYRSQLDSIGSRWELLKKQTLQTQQQSESLLEQNSILRSRICLLEEEMAQRLSERNRQLQDFERLEKRLALREGQLEQAKISTEQRGREIGCVQLQKQQIIQRQAIQISRLKTTLSELKYQQQGRQAQLQQFRAQHELLQKMVAELRSSLKKCEGQNFTLDRELSRARQEGAALRREVAEGRGRLSKQSRTQESERRSRLQFELARREVQARRRSEIELMEQLFE